MIEFHNLKDQKSELKFIEKYLHEKNPSIRAYVIASQLKQAEYMLNPIGKISAYNKYKNKLNSLITAYPTNVSSRYMRLVVQERVPKMLSCSKLIQEDKLFLKKYVADQVGTSTQLVKYIKRYTSL